ncbi:hypothetical protein EPA93_33415 [Ktedonosporobacter rubrisoli]|uniref:Uncharacterized protein n=1 Tax=Ktedonosporobacter rubrisoli TaxID=2509675 RepID=A0A4V0YZR2_KTERU|nr:hypothetical protein [Ktedonosporobacter rubrisoli]QBD80611.1 hypothetical protein EPA93_33415 [Ktedonosporobacter rubrisoli]
MASPRITAAIIVLLLIGIFSLGGIVGVSWLGPRLVHGSNVEHEDGTIIGIGPGKNFVLKNTGGQKLHFECSDQCRASLGHLQRHLSEKAHTDVYYMREADGVLLVIDVD